MPNPVQPVAPPLLLAFDTPPPSPRKVVFVFVINATVDGPAFATYDRSLLSPTRNESALFGQVTVSCWKGEVGGGLAMRWMETTFSFIAARWMDTTLNFIATHQSKGPQQCEQW